MFRRENIARFASAALGEASADPPGGVGVYADLHGLPPVLLHVGATEFFSVTLGICTSGFARLEVVAGWKFYDVPQCWHMLIGLVPEATASLRDAAKFIAEPVGAPASRRTRSSITVIVSTFRAARALCCSCGVGENGRGK